MELPRYHDDVVPGNIAQRVWDFVYALLRRNPRLPFRLVTEAIRSSLFWEDEEFGYFPRLGTVLALPTVATVNMVRRAVKVGSSTMPREFKSAFPREEIHQNITPNKMDIDESTQILGKMPSQHSSLRQILQGGVVPFTNIRPTNIKLGSAISVARKNPFNQMLARDGTVSVPFALRFHSDESNKRTNSVMVFRHNKKGIDYQFKDYVVGSAGLLFTNSTSADVTLDYFSSLEDQEQGNGISDTVLPGAAKTFTEGEVIPVGSNAYPTDSDPLYQWGYDTNTKVLPAQYNRGNVVYPKIGTVDMQGPFESVPVNERVDGVLTKPQFLHIALNRSDLEDLSLQLQPVVFRRQGTLQKINFFGGNNVQKTKDAASHVANTGDMATTESGFTNIEMGWVGFSNQHSHPQKSVLSILNAADDTLAPRGGHPDGKRAYNTQGLGISFRYDAILKTGGVRYTCVNRGGSGCNVDVHVFKLKKKHIESHGQSSTLEWDDIVKSYQDAYIKRAHEIITADDLRGRDPQEEDIWSNPKYPLLPGSSHINREDEYLTRLQKINCYIPSQGRKNINVVFPGRKYDPNDFELPIGDDLPDYDEFTYFCLMSVTGEKSNAMFSSKGSLGTSTRVVSIPASSHSASSTFGPIPGFGYFDGGLQSSVGVVYAGDDPKTSNSKYDDWCVNTNWNFEFQLRLTYLASYVEHHGYDVLGWTTFYGWYGSIGGYYYHKWFKVPLPTLEEWIQLGYEDAYDLHGNTWAPSAPVVTKTSHQVFYVSRNYYGHTSQRSAGYREYVAAIVNEPFIAPPPPATIDVDVPFSSVRTNFLFLFFS